MEPQLHGVPGGRSATVLSFALHRAERERAARARLWGRIVGMVFLWTSGIHLGIVVAGPSFYRHFADASFLPFVRQGWAGDVMADPVTWGLLLVAGEATLGGLLVAGGRAARVGWVGVIAFHVLLMLFGFGFWLWALPAIAVLVPLARQDWSGLGRVGRPRPAAQPAARPEPSAPRPSGRPPIPAGTDPQRARAMQRSWADHPANGGPAPRRGSPGNRPGRQPRSRARTTFSRRTSGLSLVPPSRDNQS